MELITDANVPENRTLFCWSCERIRTAVVCIVMTTAWHDGPQDAPFNLCADCLRKALDMVELTNEPD